MKNKLLKICSFLIILSILTGICACDNNAHMHNFSSIKYNRTAHWKECACKEKKDIADHVIENGRCRECDWGASNFKVDEYNDDMIYFGTYPQTQVANNSLIESLNNLVCNPKESTDGWTRYDYYQSNVLFDGMFYKDVDFEGEKYRGVYIKEYKPTWMNFSTDVLNSYQPDHGYYKNNVYWFKFEPIKWNILYEGEGTITILTDLAIDAQHFNIETNEKIIFTDTVAYNQSANYKDSLIRKWLTNDFYNTSFSSAEQAIINTVKIDNGKKSTGLDTNRYTCEDTEDKVFLISYVDMITYFEDDGEREKQGTDYAKCQGLLVVTDSTDRCYGNVCWWLRSPTGWHKDSVWHVSADGHYDYYFHGASSTSVGIVPAVTITI